MDPSPRLPALPSDGEPFERYFLPVAWSQTGIKNDVPNPVTANLPDIMENSSPYGLAGMRHFTRYSISPLFSETPERRQWRGLPAEVIAFRWQKHLSKRQDPYRTVSCNEVLLKKLGYGN